MSTITRKIEIGANVAIMVAALVITGVFVRNYAINRPPIHQITAGTKFALENVDWHASEKTMVFVLSTTCHFCSESAEFYRDLVVAAKEYHIRTVAVFPQPVVTARSYLKGLGLQFDEVRQSSLGSVEVSGTPTLLLIDRAGTVRNVWVGKLPGIAEKQVLGKITS